MDRSALDAKYAEIPKGRKGFLYQRELLSHRCRYQRKFLLKEKLSPTPAPAEWVSEISLFEEENDL